MACPPFNEFMLPLLQSLADGREVHLRQLLDVVAIKLKLTQDDREEMLPSGRKSRLEDRVSWAKTYLQMAGLVEAPSRGLVRITAVGQKALALNPPRIDDKFLRRYPSYVDFHTPKRRGKRRETEKPELPAETNSSPYELVERGYAELRANLSAELLDQVRKIEPAAFERLVVELMVKIGYGGSFADAARAVGRSGDGGIDGIIKEDLLGLDTIYLQAKRYGNDNPVGDSEIRNFIGSLATKKAKKGVFITTSTFRQKAEDMASTTEYRLVLIDGKLLADLMIDHGLGVSVVQTYNVQRLDSDYFEQL